MSRDMTRQSGFTLVEISLAMAIFTFMLLVVSLSYINIARLYNASTAARTVQQNNRFAMEQITRNARSANKATIVNGGLCLESSSKTTYFYLRNVGGGDALKNELVQADACTSPESHNPRTLTSAGSYAAKLEAEPEVGAVTVSLWMVSKTNLLDTVDVGALRCKGGVGSEFCSINKLTTTVELRGE